MPTITQTEVEQFLASLRYERDEREPPDDQRRAHFLSGWNDYTKRNREYSEQTLAGLTWQNLGFRFAKRFGEQTKEEIRCVYDLIALRMIDMAKGSLQTGMAYWTIGGENDSEVEIRYRKTDSTFYFELELKDPVNGDSEVSGTLTKNELGIFNGSYTYKWEGSPYDGTISGCRMTKDKLSGRWFEDRTEYGWHVEFSV